MADKGIDGESEQSQVGPSTLNSKREIPNQMSATVARIVSGIGRFLIASGLLILLFAGFQLWGTGLAEARAQSSLEDEFLAKLADAQAQPADTSAIDSSASSDDAQTTESPGSEPTSEVDPPAETDSSAATDADTSDNTASDNTASDNTASDNNVIETAAPLPPATMPTLGEAVGQLKMPSIGVTKTFVAGTSRDILRSGPGHYEGTPLPGQPGNAAIAGHRTTHGAPFFDIHKLQPGDQILVDTLQGSFTYEVEGHDTGAGTQRGHFIVDPAEIGVIADKGDNRLTLTACHPQYSAQQRIIVTAVLVSNPAPAAVVVEAPDNLGPDEEPGDGTGDAPDGGTAPGGNSDSGSGDGEFAAGAIEAGSSDPSNTLSDSSVARSLGWQPDFAKPTALWAGVAALIALAGWLVGRFWRRWPAYAMTIPPFGLALFYCFTNLDKFIPAV